jgi:hypothetical protein
MRLIAADYPILLRMSVQSKIASIIALETEPLQTAHLKRFHWIRDLRCEAGMDTASWWKAVLWAGIDRRRRDTFLN